MRPLATSRRAISTPSWRVRPFSQSSSQTMRTPTRKSAPTRARTACSTSMVKRAAVLVLALVGGGRPELIGEVAVAFDLQAVEAGRLAALGRHRVLAHDARDVPILGGFGKGAMRGLADRARRHHRQPVALAPGGAAAQVRDLDHHGGAVLVDGVGELAEPRHDLVLVECDVAEGLRTVRRHHRGAPEHGERDPALRLLGVVEPVALLGQAILGVGGLVRRRHQAIAQPEMLQLIGLQERIARAHRGLVACWQAVEYILAAVCPRVIREYERGSPS